MTCGGGQFRVCVKVEIQGCRATRSHRSTSSKLPPPLDRRGQRAARLWPLLNGGEAGQVGHCSHRAALPTPHFPQVSGPCSKLSASYLPATYPSFAQVPWSSTSEQRTAVPYSAFPSERAARLALLAHRPRGFSPPSLSLFYRCRPLLSAPALPNPRPQFACPPQSTHNHNHNPQPHFLPAPLPSSFSPAANTHFVPWCSNNLQPRVEAVQFASKCRPRTSPSPARRTSRWILPTSGEGLRQRSQNLPLFPLLQQLLLPPPRSLPLRPRPSRHSTAQSR